MSIGIPDLSANDTEDLKKMEADVTFQLDVCAAFLARITTELKHRRATAKIGPRDVADLPNKDVLRKPH